MPCLCLYLFIHQLIYMIGSINIFLQLIIHLMFGANNSIYLFLLTFPNNYFLVLPLKDFNINV